jgi:hypothetical protein
MRSAHAERASSIYFHVGIEKGRPSRPTRPNFNNDGHFLNREKPASAVQPVQIRRAEWALVLEGQGVSMQQWNARQGGGQLPKAQA